MLRLTGSLRLRPSSKIFRTPDISMPRARSAIQWSDMLPLQRAAELDRHLLGQLVHDGSHLAHRLGPVMGVERQAAGDQFAEVVRSGPVSLANRHAVAEPRPRAD